MKPGVHRRISAAFAAVDWGRAACRESGLTWFPADDGYGVKQAVRDCKALCAGCPIRTECLRFALVSGEYGIWGGTTHHERVRSRHRLRKLVGLEKAA